MLLTRCSMTGKAVLVVDDDPLIRWALEKEFSSLGATVTLTGSGRTALDEICAMRYDLVLLDIHLPDANGIELLAEIGTLSPETRVIVMSADADEENRRRSIAGGAVRFLEKPFELPVIHGVVRSALGGYSDERRGRRHPCSIPVKFALLSPVAGVKAPGIEDFTGVAREVGVRGIRIATAFPLKEGQAVRLRFGTAGPEDAPQHLTPRDGAAEVLWVVPTPDGFDAGLRYLSPAPAS